MGWRQLNSGSSLRVFSGCDPIRVLALNLGFWVSPVVAAASESFGSWRAIAALTAISILPTPLGVLG
jgi:hypothetical protein